MRTVCGCKLIKWNSSRESTTKTVLDAHRPSASSLTPGVAWTSARRFATTSALTMGFGLKSGPGTTRPSALSTHGRRTGSSALRSSSPRHLAGEPATEAGVPRSIGTCPQPCTQTVGHGPDVSHHCIVIVVVISSLLTPTAGVRGRGRGGATEENTCPEARRVTGARGMAAWPPGYQHRPAERRLCGDAAYSSREARGQLGQRADAPAQTPGPQVAQHAAIRTAAEGAAPPGPRHTPRAVEHLAAVGRRQPAAAHSVG